MIDNTEKEAVAMRIFVRCQKNPKVQLVEVNRNLVNGETDIYLLSSEEIISTGWVPEVVCRTNRIPETIDVVIRPDLATCRLKHFVNRDIIASQVGQYSVIKAKAVAQQESGISAKSAEERECSKAKDGTDVLYQVTFKNREVRVNGFRISKPNFNSENEVVFDFIYRNPGRNIDIQEIEEYIHRPVMKKLREIVRDLGFVHELKEIFFPDISKRCIRFINPVTRRDFELRELKAPQMKHL